MKKIKFNNVLNVLSILMLAGISLYLMINFKTIPYNINMSQNFLGNICNLQSKYGLIIVPIISLLFYIILTIIEKNPHIWNVGVKKTHENKEKLNSTIANFIATLKFIAIFFFSYIVLATIFNLALSSMLIYVIFLLDFVFWFYKFYKIQ